jgi:hypothetical protein
MFGSTRTGCVASVTDAGVATFVSDAATLVEQAATGCPQFVQKPVPDSSFDPQFVQKAMGEFVAGAASTDAGTVDAIVGDAETASATGSACTSSRFPHSVQKTESISASTPQEEQTGHVTVTAEEGCAPAGIGLPHDVQKLAESSI